ncbi:hypothetical protein HY346_02460 [Candidatus Microgenomates bacterium]|nr:hypothetical protein [Candidatus Microgenomates bacterium]
MVVNRLPGIESQLRTQWRVLVPERVIEGDSLVAELAHPIEEVLGTFELGSEVAGAWVHRSAVGPQILRERIWPLCINSTAEEAIMVAQRVAAIGQQQMVTLINLAAGESAATSGDGAWLLPVPLALVGYELPDSGREQDLYPRLKPAVENLVLSIADGYTLLPDADWLGIGESERQEYFRGYWPLLIGAPIDKLQSLTDVLGSRYLDPGIKVHQVGTMIHCDRGDNAEMA